MILAEIPFQCPQCERSYRMKVDLLKLTRLNRIAVCGRCKHQFDVSIKLNVSDVASERPGSAESRPPMRLTPSHVPIIDTPTPIPEDDSVPPTSGPYRGSDSPEPPPISGPNRRTRSAPGWPRSDPSIPATGPRKSKLPDATSPRLGWSKRRVRRDKDTEPPLPRADQDTDPSSMPFGLQRELERREQPTAPGKRSSLVRKRRKEIVVEVGDRRNRRKRRRTTYDPDSLITDPEMKRAQIEGDDDR